MYSINFTVTKKKFCLSLLYNGPNSQSFVNGTDISKFKVKDSGYVYDFRVVYDATDVEDIVDVHKYLIKKITQFK